jgi:hypothetical protein
MVHTRSGGATVVAPRSQKRASAAANGSAKRPRAESSAGHASSSGADDDDGADDDSWPQEVPILARNVFIGQIRLMAGARPPTKGQPGGVKTWKSVLLTTEDHFARFVAAINSTTYSKTSGKGGAPIAVPIKKARPCWGKQAVLVVVSRSPFVTHKLSIDRRSKGDYWALAGLKDKRALAAPSGFGSFDACIFDLADDESTTDPLSNAYVRMTLQGKGDYLVAKPCEALPSGPEWD